MFLNIDKHNPNSISAIYEDTELTYGELVEASRQMSFSLRGRTLVFALCENVIGSLVGYVSFLSNDVVPLLLDSEIPMELIDALISKYNPSFIWTPDRHSFKNFSKIYSAFGYTLYNTKLDPFPLNEKLALLATTSGSTGSPKLVRQSYANIMSNAMNISEYLGLNSSERPITTLPMQYVYGTSVINSHLFSGAAILLTTKGILQKEFWDFFKERKATSIAGVPYTYEMLKKLRFTTMQLPSLKTMTQSGGKLDPGLHRFFAEYAGNSGKHFVAMYGAAEATSRMSYLPPENSQGKYGSIGIAIPNGRFELVDESGNVLLDPNTMGELVYYGDNVTLGYAECGEDLAKGDERFGRLETGDYATCDEDGFYTIVGRKARFLKIFGNRVSLDETELLIKSSFPNLECACAGVDDKMYIFITDQAFEESILQHITRLTSLHPLAFTIKIVDEIPKNTAGKTLYSKLEEHYENS
ncbi:MAG: AMP-binding protein [Oscillospiraceae bacterium]|nr:AMP-binding protein [Oscillospiraceae bacterium]